MKQCIIYLKTNFFLNLHFVANPEFSIPLYFHCVVLATGAPRYFLMEWMFSKAGAKKTFLYSDFMSHPAAYSTPKLSIIITICAPRRSVWNLIAIGNILSKSPAVIESFLFQFPRILQLLLALFFSSHQWSIHFHSRDKNRAGNIQFTGRQKRWFHQQYNITLHGV